MKTTGSFQRSMQAPKSNINLVPPSTGMASINTTQKHLRWSQSNKKEYSTGELIE